MKSPVFSSVLVAIAIIAAGCSDQNSALVNPDLSDQATHTVGSDHAPAEQTLFLSKKGKSSKVEVCHFPQSKSGKSSKKQSKSSKKQRKSSKGVVTANGANLISVSAKSAQNHISNHLGDGLVGEVFPFLDHNCEPIPLPPAGCPVWSAADFAAGGMYGDLSPVILNQSFSDGSFVLIGETLGMGLGNWGVLMNPPQAFIQIGSNPLSTFPLTSEEAVACATILSDQFPN